MPKIAGFTFTKENYIDAKRTIGVGGLPLNEWKEVSDTYIPTSDDTGELKITCTDAETGKKLSPKFRWFHELTGESGTKLKKLKPGNYLVYAEKDDYFDVVKPVWVMSGAVHELNFAMVASKGVNSS